MTRDGSPRLLDALGEHDIDYLGATVTPNAKTALEAQYDAVVRTVEEGRPQEVHIRDYESGQAAVLAATESGYQVAEFYDEEGDATPSAPATPTSEAAEATRKRALGIDGHAPDELTGDAEFLGGGVLQESAQVDPDDERVQHEGIDWDAARYAADRDDGR